MIRGFVIGAIATVAVAAVAAFATVSLGLLPAGADQKPPAIERWAAKTSLHAAMRRDTPNLHDPLPLTDANLSAGVKLYAADCLFCHGAADKQASTAAKGFYIRAPQLADDGVEDDPEGVTYWKIAHGIRFTAMPAFGKNLTDEQMWQITQFVAHMDKLPPAVDAEWKKVPSAAEQHTT